MKKEYVIISILLIIIIFMFYRDNKTKYEIANYQLEVKKEMILNKIKIVDSMNKVYNCKIDSINKKINNQNEKYNTNKKVINGIGGLPKL